MFLSVQSVEGIKLVLFVKDVDLLKSLLTHMSCHIAFNFPQTCTFPGILVGSNSIPKLETVKFIGK